jgi:Sensors of blue-light using FAD
MLAHLSYISRRTAVCSDQEIGHILQAALDKNPRVQITGVLLYSEKKFFQYVEGEYNALIKLYEKIKLDPRHNEVRLVSLGPIKVRTFANWHMGQKKLSTDDIELITEQSMTHVDELQKVLASEETGRNLQELLKKFFN